MWVWMKPGRTYAPRASITRSCRSPMVDPMAATRPSRTDTSPSMMSKRSFIVRMTPPRTRRDTPVSCHRDARRNPVFTSVARGEERVKNCGPLPQSTQSTPRILGAFRLGGLGGQRFFHGQACQKRLNRVLLCVPRFSAAAVEVVPLHRQLGGVARAQLAVLHGNQLGENAHGDFLRRDGADIEADRRVHPLQLIGGHRVVGERVVNPR